MREEKPHKKVIEQSVLNDERRAVLGQIEDWLETPMLVLGFGLSLALYGFAVFGYVTATIATFFVGRDAESDDAELAGAKSVAALRTDIVALRNEVRSLTRALALRDTFEGE